MEFFVLVEVEARHSSYRFPSLYGSALNDEALPHVFSRSMESV
jgi:hypothetical protein